MSFDSARSLRCSSSVAFRNCSSSRSAAFRRTLRRRSPAPASGPGPCPCWRRAASRTGCSHDLRCGSSSSPRELRYAAPLSPRRALHRLAAKDRFSGSSRGGVTERPQSRCAPNRRRPRIRCADRWRWMSGSPGRRTTPRRRRLRVSASCAAAAVTGRAVTTSARIPRREDGPDAGRPRPRAHAASPCSPACRRRPRARTCRPRLSLCR